MTFRDKRELFLRLCEQAEKAASDWEKRYSGPGFFAKVNRIAHMPGLYMAYVLARFGYTPPDKKARTFWGYPMLLPGLGFDSFRLAAFGTLGYKNEEKLIRFLIRTLQPSDVFYDVGASYGFYTYLASEFIEQGEIHAFEPLPEVFSYLEYNTREKTNCFCNRCVLSDQDGPTSFYKGYPSTVSSTMVARVARSNTWNAYQKIEVLSTTLDCYLKNHKQPTFVKIDTEGAESLIIKGGLHFFSRNSPTIVMEVWGGEKGRRFSLPAVQELFRLGYSPHAITTNGSLEKKEAGEVMVLRENGFDNFVFQKE